MSFRQIEDMEALYALFIFFSCSLSQTNRWITRICFLTLRIKWFNRPPPLMYKTKLRGHFLSMYIKMPNFPYFSIYGKVTMHKIWVFQIIIFRSTCNFSVGVGLESNLEFDCKYFSRSSVKNFVYSLSYKGKYLSASRTVFSCESSLVLA